MKYVLDFDRVIFDVWKYQQAVQEKQLDHLSYTPEMWDTLAVTDFLYADALSFIESKDSRDVVILSAATPSYGPRAVAFQHRKLERSGLKGTVEEIIVMQGAKGEVLKEQYGNELFVFVDDKLEQLLSAQEQCANARCIQLVRAGQQPEGTSVSRDASIPIVTDFAQVRQLTDAWENVSGF